MLTGGFSGGVIVYVSVPWDFGENEFDGNIQLRLPFQITVVHPVLPDDDNDSKEANEDSGPASFGQVCCSCFTTKL